MNGFGELVYQLPVAGLLLVVVGIFMRFIKERDEAWINTVRERDQQFIENIKVQNLRTEGIQKEMVEALRHVAVNEDRTAQVLTRLERKLDDDELKRETRRREAHAN